MVLAVIQDVNDTQNPLAYRGELCVCYYFSNGFLPEKS